MDLSIEFGVKILEDIVAAGYDFLKTEQKKRDLFGKATERYVKGLIERFGEVKVLGMNRPVPLLSLYVRANILEKITARMGAKAEELEEFFDFDRRAFGKTRETKDGEAIANQLQRFIVLGKPGAGKTTFLKYLALAMVHRQSLIKKRRLPIFVTLRDWADKKSSLMDYIGEQFDICGFEQAGLFVEHLLKQGNCLVLLDGLDEVSQEANLDGIIREIRDFTDKYSDNQFVMSCRVAAYNHWFERFTDVEMADFNQEQIETFVRNWFRDEPNTGEECLKHLKNSPQLKELSSVPLLLTLLCITYDENNYFPANKAELYKEAVETLLKKWDSSRRIRRDDPYKQLSLMQKENMFARIAYGTFSENRYFIREQELTKMIGNFIGNLPAFKAENLEVDSAEVLRTIEAHHGIFVERAKHIHSFAHLTFQEYFTAKYIVDNDNSQNPEIMKLVQEHLYDDKWKEVFLLVSGMLHNADELLLLMIRMNRKLLRNPVLNNFLTDTTKTLLPIKSIYLSRARVAMAMTIILARDLNIDFDVLVNDSSVDITINLIKLSGDFVSAPFIDQILAREQEFSLKLPQEEFHIQARARKQTLVHKYALDINLDVKNNFSNQFYKSLYDYLNTAFLITQCLNSAAYLSNPTREYVLSMLLAPLTEEEKAAMDIKDKE